MHRLVGLAAALVACVPATSERPGNRPPHAPPASDTRPSAPTCPARPHAELQRRLDNGDERGDHHPQYRHLSLSPDGRLVAASNDDHTALIDVQTGVQVAGVHGGSAVFTPDGDGLFVAHRDALVHIHRSDLAGGDPLVLSAPMERPPRIAIASVGELVVAYAEYSEAPLQVWDRRTRAARCTAAEALRPVAFATRTGAAWACHGPELIEWDPQTCAVVRRYPVPWCHDLAVSSDGARVAISAGKLVLFDVATAQWVPHYLADPTIGEVQALGDGTLLVAGGSLRRFDPRGDRPGARETFLPTTDLAATGLAVAADESVVVAMFEDVRGPRAASLRRWSLPERRYLGDLGAAPRLLAPLLVAPGGATFLARGAGRSVHLHLTATAAEIASDSVVSTWPGFSRDGGCLALRDRNTLWIRDGRTGELLHTFPDPPGRRYSDTPRSHVFSPDAAHLFVGEVHGDHALIALQSGARTTLRAHTDAAGDIDAVFSPDGRSLLIRSAVGQVTLWDVRTGRRLRVLGDAALRFGDQPFSADGRRIALDGAGEVVLLDAATGRPRRRIRGFTRPALSADGRRLLAIDAAGRPALLDAGSGEPSWILPVDGALAALFLADDRAEVATAQHVSTWSLVDGTRLTRHGIPFRASHTRLADGRRLAVEDQALVLHAADGSVAASFAATADGKTSVAWTPDGAWDGDESLLRFSDGRTPCTGTPARRGELWTRALDAPDAAPSP